MLNPAVIELKVPRFAAYLKATHRPNDWKEVLAKTAAMMTDLGNHPPLTPTVFASIAHQTLIGIGDQDNMVSLEESSRVAGQLANGHLHVLAGFQHPIAKNDMDQLAQLITDFVEGAYTPSSGA